MGRSIGVSSSSLMLSATGKLNETLYIEELSLFRTGRGENQMDVPLSIYNAPWVQGLEHGAFLKLL